MQPIIQLIRVDNRLVHGQTGVTWSNSLDIDTIIVIDDETVQNIFSQKLMTSIAKAGNVHIAFYSIAGFIDAYFSASGGKKLFLVVKSIQVVRTLYEQGLRFPRINIGNIHYERGTNENINRMIRRWFPKGTDFGQVPKKAIQAVEDWLNAYPREILGFRSADEVFAEGLAALG